MLASETTLAAGQAVGSFGPSPPGTSALSLERDYVLLKQLIRKNGLLQKRPLRTALRALAVTAMLGFTVAVVARGGNHLVLQLLNGIFLGFVFTQFGFLMHEAGHRQIFRSASNNDVFGMLCANLLLGLSYSWWVDKHDRHHRDPNHPDLDPDIDFPVLAFSEEQALAKTRPWRSLVKYQAFYFFPLLLVEFFNLRALSIEHLLRGRSRQPWREGLLIGCHYGLYLGLVFSLLDTIPAIVFVAASQASVGLYAGVVFAPNHKGMAILERGGQASFIDRQVPTARNVRPNPVNDFLYGGLNYQIEHHLFPSLARHQMPAAHRIVKTFCRDRGIPYHETGVVQSFREVLSYLHQVSALLRVKKLSQAPAERGTGHESEGTGQPSC